MGVPGSSWFGVRGSSWFGAPAHTPGPPKEHLPGYMRPAAAEIVAELPKTSTGKIQKASLRAKEWEGRGRRIG